MGSYSLGLANIWLQNCWWEVSDGNPRFRYTFQAKLSLSCPFLDLDLTCSPSCPLLSLHLIISWALCPHPEMPASMKPSLASGNKCISCWCCHSCHFCLYCVTFACLGWVWTYRYHSQEQPLLFTGSCWSSIEANSMVSRHSIFPRIKLVSKKSWCQYQTSVEKYVLQTEYLSRYSEFLIPSWFVSQCL